MEIVMSPILALRFLLLPRTSLRLSIHFFHPLICMSPLLKKLIKPTHGVVKNKKIRKNRGKKISLPNIVAPIIVVPQENESIIIVEDDALDDDFVMPITCCDDYDWENNDTSYNLGNLFGTNLGNYDDSNCYTIGSIHTINDESYYAYDMPSHKLGDAMFDENDMFENVLLQLMFVPSLGMLRLMKMIFLVPLL